MSERMSSEEFMSLESSRRNSLSSDGELSERAVHDAENNTSKTAASNTGIERIFVVIVALTRSNALFEPPVTAIRR